MIKFWGVLVEDPTNEVEKATDETLVKLTDLRKKFFNFGIKRLKNKKDFDEWCKIFYKQINNFKNENINNR